MDSDSSDSEDGCDPTDTGAGVGCKVAAVAKAKDEKSSKSKAAAPRKKRYFPPDHNHFPHMSLIRSIGMCTVNCKYAVGKLLLQKLE